MLNVTMFVWRVLRNGVDFNATQLSSERKIARKSL